MAALGSQSCRHADHRFAPAKRRIGRERAIGVGCLQDGARGPSRMRVIGLGYRHDLCEFPVGVDGPSYGLDDGVRSRCGPVGKPVPSCLRYGVGQCLKLRLVAASFVD
ncbi:hypothetical protein NJB1907f44_40600 [Mycobacterium marinum]|nr:hypothetical protein NJB1808e29_11620 [Mycobacterium marinum]GJO31051.1 hypothetical protein NJB1907E19_02630 [Mycobacterium marinum]GJO70878.1 hypothetical protein NJB1907f34a_26780 [Mycobacterium marinum]GJO85899.1 hypothetical protein NJB1728910S_18330 [Mycobacterium marinum]GJO96410.1 hypothetical protein NJB1907f44_40600 [Mycobacterium marinum]